MASTGASLTGDLVPVIAVCQEPNTYSLFVDFIKMLVGCRFVVGWEEREGRWAAVVEIWSMCSGKMAPNT